jgi:dipeptidyl aminopeptidase/acylaminoacyl peptidase
MPDLKTRFRGAERITTPDLWPDITSREPRRPALEQSLTRRVLVATLALVVASAGIGLAVRAFRTSEQPPEPAATVRNGRIAFAAYSDGHWQIFSVEPDGSEPSQLTSLATDQFHPAWSPDGGRIAFSSQRVGGDMEISVMDADGSNLEQLTEGPGSSYLPAWSPDGSKIAFVSNRAGNDEIYVMDSDGSNQVRLTDNQDVDLSPAWSPDGTRLLFQSSRTGNNEIFVMSSDGAEVRNVTHAPTSGEFDPAWSPDGSRIAFVSDRDGNPEIYVLAADGSRLTRLTNDPGHDWHPTWAPDGSGIAFESDRDGSVALYTMDVDGTKSARLTDTAEACCPSWQPVLTEEGLPTPTMSPRVTATIPVGSFPQDIAVGAGAVWVTVNDFPQDEHWLLRIDPETNEIVANIPVNSAGHVAVGSAAVWTIDDIGGSRDGVLRIDPTTNEVMATIPVGSYAFDVAVDSTGVWVTRDIDSAGRSGEVIRIDPLTNEIVARIPVKGRIRDVVVGGGGVWVHDSTSTLREGPSLVHVDPLTEQVVGRIPGLAVGDVAAQSGVVWFQGWLSSIEPSVGTGAGDRLLALRMDSATNRLVGEPVRLDGFRPFAVVEDGVWFVGEGPSVSHLNTQTFEVDHSVPVEPVATDSAIHAAFDPSTGTIWVANYEDTITRIDLR